MMILLVMLEGCWGVLFFNCHLSLSSAILSLTQTGGFPY